MFAHVLLLLLVVSSLMIMESYHHSVSQKWSSCSKQCRPGYQYRFHSDDPRSIEYRSCFEQDSTCLVREYAKNNEQFLFIQESRREYLSHTLIQVIILLSVAIILTLCIPLLASIYLFRDTSIENYN